jgi:hypothetical protein
MEEWLEREGAYEPFPPNQWERIKAMFAAPLPPVPADVAEDS